MELSLYDNIADEVVWIINNDLKLELQKYMLIVKEAGTQVVYEGYIDIIYSIVRGFLEIVSEIKDLYDVV